MRVLLFLLLLAGSASAVDFSEYVDVEFRDIGIDGDLVDYVVSVSVANKSSVFDGTMVWFTVTQDNNMTSGEVLRRRFCWEAGRVVEYRFSARARVLNVSNGTMELEPPLFMWGLVDLYHSIPYEGETRFSFDGVGDLEPPGFDFSLLGFLVAGSLGSLVYLRQKRYLKAGLVFLIGCVGGLLYLWFG